MAKPYVLQSADLANTLNGEIGNFSALSTEDNSSIINGLNEVAVAGYETAVTTSTEINTITVNKNKQIKITDIKGKTVINLLGNDGDCEDTSRWSLWNCTSSLDSTNKVFSSNGIKFVTTNSAGANLAKDCFSIIDKTKYYCISAYIKNGNTSGGVVCAIEMANSATTWKQSATVTDTTKFNRGFLKVQPSDMVGATTFLVHPINTGVNTVGQYAYVDGVMLEEITSAQYNDSSFVPSPYINADFSVGETVTRIKTRGKNLINLVQGKYDTNGNFLLSTTRISHKDGVIVVKPNTTYTISSSSALSYIYGEFDSNKCLLSNNVWMAATTGFSITTGSNTRYLGVDFKIDDTTVIYAENYQIQLEVGSTATTYESYKESYFNIQYPLRSLSNGTIDEVVNINGTPKLIQRIGKYNLDGSLPWVYDSSGTGYKLVKLVGVIPNFLDMSCNILKYNSKWLTKNSGSITSGDNCSLWNTSNTMWISIPIADSGWADSYTPSVAEIQAYFWGWKMYDSNTYTGATALSTTTATYSGSGTKCWVSLINSGNAGTTCPTSSSATFPYRLYTQLNTPVITDLNQPELVAFYNNGNASSLIIESDWGFITPTITYQISDNTKANVDDLMKNVNDAKRLSTMTNGQVNSSFPFGLAVQAGTYRVADGSGIVDGPWTSGGIWGLLRVYVSSDQLVWNKTNNWIWQYFDSTNGGICYFRYAVNNGNWSTWRQLPVLDTTGGLINKGFKNPYSGILTGATTLDTGAFGGFFEMSGSSIYTTTIPTPIGAQGATITFWNNASNSASMTITPSAGSIYGNGYSGSSITIPSDTTLTLMSDGYNWIAIGGTYLGGGRVVKAMGGTGFKMQSGAVSLTVTAGGGVSSNVTFPAAFSSNPVVFVSSAGFPTDNVYNNVDGRSSTTTGFQIYYASGAAQTITVFWLAISS